MIAIMPATKEQLHYFAQHIRKADAKEVFHATGIYDRTHLYATLCHLKGVMAVTLSDGSLLGIGGIEPLNEDTAKVWLLLTTNVEKHKIEFIRWSKKFKEVLLQHYRVITNVVWLCNYTHVVYLNYLGVRWRRLKGNWGTFTITREEKVKDTDVYMGSRRTDGLTSLGHTTKE